MADMDSVLGDRSLTEEIIVTKTAIYMEYEEPVKNEEIS